MLYIIFMHIFIYVYIYIYVRVCIFCMYRVYRLQASNGFNEHELMHCLHCDVWLYRFSAQGLLKQCPAWRKCIGFQCLYWLPPWRFARQHFSHQWIPGAGMVCLSQLADSGRWSFHRMPDNLHRPAPLAVLAASVCSVVCQRLQRVLWLPPAQGSSSEQRRLLSAFFPAELCTDRRPCDALSPMVRFQHGPENRCWKRGWCNHGESGLFAGCLHLVAICMKGQECGATTTSMCVSSPSMCCVLSRRGASTPLIIWWPFWKAELTTSAGVLGSPQPWQQPDSWCVRITSRSGPKGYHMTTKIQSGWQ